MRSKFYIISLLLTALCCLFSSEATAGWTDLHFKPQHWVWGNVENAADGTGANARTAQLYRGNDQTLSAVNNNQYFINAFRLPGVTWAPGQTINASVPLANNYEAGPVDLINPPSKGSGIEQMSVMRMATADERVGGSQLALTAYLEGFYHSADGSQVETDVEVEARETPTSAPAATAHIRLHDGSGVNGFGIDLNGPYYLVITHYNHLAVITEAPVQLVPEDMVNPTAFVAQDSAQFRKPQETLPDPLTLAGTTPVLRGGNIDANNLLNIDDWYIWYKANGSNPALANWDLRADCNGDNMITIDDWYIWYSNNGTRSYVGE